MADPELVATILTYHVLDGAFDSTAVAGLDGSSAATVQGEEIGIAVEGESITIVSGAPTPATVTAADVAACNGIVHVIDQVLIPPTVAEALGAAPGDGEEGEETEEEPAEEEPAEEEPAEEEPAEEEELANTGVNSAQVAIAAGAVLLGGLMIAGAASPALRGRRD